MKTIRSFPAGANVWPLRSGPNKGKYAAWGLNGSRLSLSRFAGTPIYIVKTSPNATGGSAFANREEAQQCIERLKSFPECKHIEYILDEILLTADQIA